MSFPQSVRVRVPATSANLGPGFDCLGLALAVYNEVSLTRRHSGLGEAFLAKPAHQMVDDVARAFFGHAKVQAMGGRGEPFTFSWSISGDVPISRGLGSSVTLRLGILHGLNTLCGEPLSREDLFQLCHQAEGHPDNAGPGAFGGFFVGSQDGRWMRFPITDALRFVLLIPAFEVQTDPAREALPATVSLKNAAKTAAGAALLTAAFATQNYAYLKGGFEDWLHQPYRASLVPGLNAIIEAATEAGALGGFLSGSGSTIAAVVDVQGLGEDEIASTCQRIGEAMKSAHPKTGEGAGIMIAQADDQGSLTMVLDS